MRDAFRDEVTLHVRFFALTKEARGGATVDVLLGRKEMIFQPGAMLFSCNRPIQLLKNIGCSPPRVLICWRGA